jgi:hypothetical protein
MLRRPSCVVVAILAVTAAGDVSGQGAGGVKMKGKPFALVSVNTDANVETLSKSIAAGAITWRSWWDGGTTGPITTRWGISLDRLFATAHRPLSQHLLLAIRWRRCSDGEHAIWMIDCLAGYS